MKGLRNRFVNVNLDKFEGSPKHDLLMFIWCPEVGLELLLSGVSRLIDFALDSVQAESGSSSSSPESLKSGAPEGLTGSRRFVSL